jgi:hypothetical protein
MVNIKSEEQAAGVSITLHVSQQQAEDFTTQSLVQVSHSINCHSCVIDESQ